MTEGIAQLRRRARSNLVVLTFDDGYRDTLTAALPLLLRHGFSATCYLVSDRIGGHNRWDEQDGRERHALMTRDEIGRWLEAGMEIASHTCSHPRLNAQRARDLAREIGGQPRLAAPDVRRGDRLFRLSVRRRLMRGPSRW